MTCATAAAAALCVLGALAAQSWGATVTTIASGLNNPRGLAFDADGDLFVAEAGAGGTECVPGPRGPECAGLTGGVSRIDRSHVVHKVLSGMISVSGEGGRGAEGVEGVAVGEGAALYALLGLSSQQVPPSGFSKEATEKAKAQLGHLFEFNRSGQSKAIADVGGYSWKWTGEHKSLVPEQFPDANPYSVITRGGEQWLVDAAANTLDEVEHGVVKELAFIPNPEKNGKPISDAVPTCLSRGPDGAIYIGQLTGAGNGPGAAKIWRVPTGGKPEVWATGLTAVTGCGWDGDGDFYATEFSVNGWEGFEPFTGALVRVPAHSSKPVTVVSKLSLPNGFAARGDALYVSNWSVAPGTSVKGSPTGEVLQITL
jgi:hypothetical protein